MDLGWWEGWTRVSVCVCVCWGRGFTGGVSTEEETSNRPESARCFSPALLLPQSPLASLSLPGSLLRPGLKGGRVPGPGPGPRGQPGRSSAPAPLPAARAQLEGRRPGAAGRRAQTWGCKGGLGLSHFRSSWGIPCSPRNVPPSNSGPSRHPTSFLPPILSRVGIEPGAQGASVSACVSVCACVCVWCACTSVLPLESRLLGTRTVVFLCRSPQPPFYFCPPTPTSVDADRKKRRQCQGWGCVTQAAAPGGGEGRVGRGGVSREPAGGISELVAESQPSVPLLTGCLVLFSVRESAPPVAGELTL